MRAIEDAREQSDAIRLLLVDDHALFREGVSRLLATEPDLQVIAACSNISDGLKALAGNTIDLVLLDFDLGNESAIEFIRACRLSKPKTKILVVTAGVEDRSATELIAAGVAGIFHKHNEPESLSKRIRSVMSGDVYLEETYLKSLFRMAQPEDADQSLSMTPREKEVLDCLLEGLPNKIIADKLSVTEAAVKGTLQQLFQKTGVRTRSQLVRFALEHLR